MPNQAHPCQTPKKQMSGNPLEHILRTFNSFSQSLHSNLSSFLNPLQQNKTHSLSRSPLLSPSTPSSELSKDSNFTIKGKSAAPLTKEELGRNTWALLHTIAAQYPDQPTRQQKRDVKELMSILSRIYPCKECADHFKDVLRANPVQAGSQAEFSQWLCHAHNVVNRSLGKLTFPCQRVNARWGKLDCKDRACDLQGDSRI